MVLVNFQSGFREHLPGAELPGLPGSGDRVRPLVRRSQRDWLYQEHAAYQSHLWKIRGFNQLRIISVIWYNFDVLTTQNLSLFQDFYQ